MSSAATGAVNGGALNRVIRIAGRAGLIRATLEDDFHHFRVTLHHDGKTVTDISTDSLRHPYSLYPMAGTHVRALIGLALSDDVTAPMRRTDARQHCTHQLDLAVIAYIAAARGTDALRYDMAVTDPQDGRSTASLSQNAVPILQWTIAGDLIEGPSPFDTRPWGAGFTQWASETLDPAEREQALALWTAGDDWSGCMIS